MFYKCFTDYDYICLTNKQSHGNNTKNSYEKLPEG